MTEGRWPTDIVEERDAAMLGRLDGALDSLAPVREQVGNARHPWMWITAGIVIGTLLLAVVANGISPTLSWIVVIGGAGAAVWSGLKAATFQARLSDARQELDQALITDVLQLGFPGVPDDVLGVFGTAGLIGNYEKVASLRSFRCEGRDLTHAKLTRTETTRDSNGNTRTRTVTVFDGLLFELPFPDVRGEARVTIATDGRVNPRGVFDRVDISGRRRKMQRIKTSSLTFNKHHDVRTDDPVEGHALLDPDRIMRFINLEHDLSETMRWSRMRYKMLIMRGRAWVSVRGIGAPVIDSFPEGQALARKLSEAHQIFSIPSVMAHHLRLPHDKEPETSTETSS